MFDPVIRGWVLYVGQTLFGAVPVFRSFLYGLLFGMKLNCHTLLYITKKVLYLYRILITNTDIMYILTNGDLTNDLDKIKWNQESIETDLTKMAVVKAEDFNLDQPYAIDVEDTSYFYSNESDRDFDFDVLNKILTNNSNKYFY